MSTKSHPGPFDGLERAKENEPIFTLQGGDPLASRLVRIWVWQARKAVLRNAALTDEERAGKLIKIREAEVIAEDMEEYRSGHAHAAAEPETPKEERYSGHVSSPEEIEAWGLGFNLGNTAKYISRAEHKGATIQDLEKARWYLDREISNRKAMAK